jgi:ADP-heptose:LPS heptosyltransferase
MKDLIINFYKNKPDVKPKQDLSFLKEESSLNLITLNIGLGDATAMTFFTNQNIKNFNIYSPNKHWETLCKFNKKLNKFQQSDHYIRTELLEFVDLGNGHVSQRFQRAFGLNVERTPKPFLDISNNPKKNKIGLHFSTGPSAFDLLEKGFKEPRQLQHNAKIEIEKFINNSNYEFVEFGGKQVLENEKIKNFTGTSIEDSIKELSECEFFIGLNSGFMSLAAAMSIKSIIIVNVPEVYNLYLPVIKDYWEEDMNWLYPQNVHLHQNGENELVKNVTQFNIEKAINGEVYPFWNLDLLDLIFK